MFSGCLSLSVFMFACLVYLSAKTPNVLNGCSLNLLCGKGLIKRNK